MNTVEIDDLIPFYGCAKSIWVGIDNGLVGGLLSVMGVVVRDITPEGIVFYRIHDNYSPLEIAHMFYKEGIHNGKSVNLPTLYLSCDGIDAIAETFKILLAMADKNTVKFLLEKACRQKENAQASCQPEKIRQDVPKPSVSHEKTAHSVEF
jgi:hypothetical protein